MNLSPIVLFVYNRPDHTKQTIEALQKNELASDSELFIYSDAPKNENSLEKVNEVRKYIKTVDGFKKVTIIEREENLGLANSIIDGVTKIINEYGKIIVLEDDLVSSPYFLNFMNDSLNQYENREKVWHISGWNYPINVEAKEEVFLWRTMNCWGWATWKSRWEHYEKNINKIIKSFTKNDIYKFNLNNSQNFWKQVLDNKRGKINTWAIFWYATIFKNGGLCLNPVNTFLLNIGVDNSGVNSIKTDIYNDSLNNEKVFSFPEALIENDFYLNKIINFNNKFKNSRIKQVKNILKYFYVPLKNFFTLWKLRIKFTKSFISGNTYLLIDNFDNITLKENSYIGNYTTLHVFNYKGYNNSYFYLGKNSTIGELNNIRAAGGKIIIGNNCQISQYVSLIASNHKIEKKFLINEQEWDTNKTGILIEDDVWIGASSTILPGVRIKKGAIIAAGSIVNKDIEEYTINAGIPSKQIGFRK